MLLSRKKVQGGINKGRKNEEITSKTALASALWFRRSSIAPNCLLKREKNKGVIPLCEIVKKSDICGEKLKEKVKPYQAIQHFCHVQLGAPLAQHILCCKHNAWKQDLPAFSRKMRKKNGEKNEETNGIELTEVRIERNENFSLFHIIISGTIVHQSRILETKSVIH